MSSCNEYQFQVTWGCLKSLFNRKEHQGIRKVHKGKSLMLSPLRTQRNDFEAFAVNGFRLFRHPQSFSTARIYKINQQDIHYKNPCYDGNQLTITELSSKTKNH